MASSSTTTERVKRPGLTPEQKQARARAYEAQYGPYCAQGRPGSTDELTGSPLTTKSSAKGVCNEARSKAHTKYCRVHSAESRKRWKADREAEQVERSARRAGFEALWTSASEAGEAALNGIGKARAASQPDALLRVVNRQSSFHYWTKSSGNLIPADGKLRLPSVNLAYVQGFAAVLRTEGIEVDVTLA